MYVAATGWSSFWVAVPTTSAPAVWASSASSSQDSVGREQCAAEIGGDEVSAVSDGGGGVKGIWHVCPVLTVSREERGCRAPGRSSAGEDVANFLMSRNRLQFPVAGFPKSNGGSLLGGAHSRQPSRCRTECVRFNRRERRLCARWRHRPDASSRRSPSTNSIAAAGLRGASVGFALAVGAVDLRAVRPIPALAAVFDDRRELVSHGAIIADAVRGDGTTLEFDRPGFARSTPRQMPR